MKRTEWVFLCLALLCLVLLQGRVLKEIYYDHDVAGYVYNTLDIMEGRGWYSSFWHNKPPGIHLVIIAAFSIFGTRFIGLQIAAVIFQAATVVFIYLFARLFLRKEAKLYFLLPFFYAFFAVSEAIQGHTGNTETYLAFFEIAGVLFCAQAYQKKSYFLWLASGLFLGTGFMFKQAGLATGAAVLVFLACANFFDREPFSLFFKKCGCLFAGFIVPLGLFCVFFLHRGVLQKFLEHTFFYNIRYLEEVRTTRNFFLGYSLGIIWRSLSAPLVILGVFSIVGLAVSFFKRNAVRFFIVIWFFSVTVSLLRYAIFQHHFIPFFAAFVCLAVLGASDVLGLVRPERQKIAKLLVMALLILPLVFHLAQTTIRSKPVASAFGAEERFLVAQYLKRNALAGSHIFVWDDTDAGAVILWSGLRDASHFRTKYAFLPDHAMPASKRSPVGDYHSNQRGLLSDLAQRPPVYIVMREDERYSLAAEEDVFPELFNLLHKEYHQENMIGRSRIYRRL